jgi:hypothetical protein
MPTLVLKNVPLDVYDSLVEQAAANQRDVEDHAILILKRAVPDPPLDDDEELAPHLLPPCELPRPGPAIRVSVREGGQRLPDPPIIIDE